MKLTKLAIALTLTATTSAAIAARNPFPSAYDRIQDSRADVTRDLINDHQNQITQNKVDSETRDTQLGDRITRVDADLQSTKLGVITVDQKADAAQQEASSALNLAGSAKTDAQAALNGLAGKVDQTAHDADKAAQVIRDNDQDALISTNSDKADAALAGVATNGSAIIDLQTKAGTFATKPELDAGLATKVNATDFVADQARQDTAITESNTKSDAALAGVVGNGVAITNESNERKAADSDLQNQVNDRVTTSTFTADQQRQDSALADETSTRSTQFNTLSAGVKQAQDTGAYAQSRADAAYAHTEANRQALDATNKRVATNGSAIIDLQTKAGTFATKPELDAGLATKVNATDFVADQARQDTAITESNTKSDAALAGVVGNGVAITNESNERKAADSDLQNQVNDRVTTSTFTADQQRQDSALADETSTRSTQFNTLSAGVKQAQDTGAYAQSRADAAYAHTEANRQALDATNKRVAQNTADIANHEQRIQGLESQTNSKFADLNKQIDDNRKRASAGIAGVAAMANIPQVLEHQTFAIGAGAGNTDGESALAVGFSARASQNTVVKASVSNDTQHNFVVGAGVAFGW